MTNRRDFSALLAALGLMPFQASANTHWRLATGYPAETFQGKNLAQFSQSLDFRVDISPNNTLFKLADIFEAVRSGQVECGETIMSAMVKGVPLAGADSVPFVVRTYSDARRLWKYQRPLIDQKLEALGMKCLMAVPWPPQGLYTSKPMTRMTDLQGSKMRTYNQTTIRIAEMVGATPVDVPMAQMRQALAEGRMDSMITSGVTGVDNQVWRHLKHFYEINAWFPKNMTLVNMKAFQALAPHVQKNLLTAAAVAEERGWAASERASENSLEELRRHGMKVERVPYEVLLSIKRMGERFSMEWIRQVGLEANKIFIPYFTLEPA